MNITSDYSYISDPPIFADIGTGSIHISPTNVSTNIQSYLHQGTSDHAFEL